MYISSDYRLACLLLWDEIQTTCRVCFPVTGPEALEKMCRGGRCLITWMPVSCGLLHIKSAAGARPDRPSSSELSERSPWGDARQCQIRWMMARGCWLRGLACTSCSIDVAVVVVWWTAACAFACVHATLFGCFLGTVSDSVIGCCIRRQSHITLI